jgi:CelD/BcsL family acetyltransferase involved in cellulose biosynthesis/peptidoglycan/xylan/chitin deacetylase (PgdA/CDA1 family)
MLRVSHYRSLEELEALAPEWNSLLSMSAADTVFLTWEWIRCWWRAYGQERQLFVLALRDGGQLVGIAPLFADVERRWTKHWTCLRLIGDGTYDSDYLDFFTAPGQEEECASAILAFLEENRGAWDWLDLRGMPRESSCLKALMNHAAKLSWESSTAPVDCASLTLPGSWDEYLACLKPRFRTKVRSAIAFFESELQVAPTACCKPTSVDDWLSELFRLHTLRWQSKGQPGSFRDQARRSLYRELAAVASKRGWLAFNRLEWGERPLALQFGLVYHNKFNLLQEGYDPTFEYLRPGLALRGLLIREYIRAGLQEYDFLYGAADYKLDWGAQIKHCVRVILAPKGRGAWAAVAGPRYQEAAKARIRAAIPTPVLALRKKLEDWRGRREAGPAKALEPSGTESEPESLTRVALARTYCSTPLSDVTRSIARRYRVSAASGSWVERINGPTIQIFVYHRINGERDPFFPAVPVNVFRSQMEHIARNFPVISLDHIADDKCGTAARHMVAVTFDDGYRDNFLHALPILKELGIPATIFLTTHAIETGELPWYDQVALAFKLTTRTRFDLGPVGPEMVLGDVSSRLQAFSAALRWLRELDQKDRVVATAELFRQLAAPTRLRLPKAFLGWDEVRQMSKQGIDFGGHTVTHPVLAKTDRLDDEIVCCKKTIEKRLQRPVRHFAYPFGRACHFSDAAKRTIQAAGFETAVTTMWGFNRPGDDAFELKRFNPWEHDPSLFALKMDYYRLFGPPVEESSSEAAPEATPVRTT